MPPPLDAEGVPCGGCPSCGQGEFWRWPKFHPEHDPRGWVCWFCSPPPPDSGPCDFCGVPDQMLKSKETERIGSREVGKWLGTDHW